MFRIHRLDTTDQGVAMFRDRHRTTLPAIGIGVVAAFALAACSAGSSGTSSASSAIAPAGCVQD